ncbi:molybdenum cofactor guanylyltransferase [Herbiconiux sp. A18JL235]|uniref:Molybdenum cofactor guanylyltransferase n=1 Tax=Herbiconiux sp. A18JL235 TaxID=3152363 RepID=A0AB39BI23_9MICO
MHVDVIVLAGGRSSRLDGVAKASLVVGSTTLLQRAVEAGRGAVAVGEGGSPGTGGRVVVVGPDDETTALGDTLRDPRASSCAVLRTREAPPFGGPAAGIAAGLAALSGPPAPAAAGPAAARAPLVAVIACDHPRVDRALPAVLAAVLRDGADESIDAWAARGRDDRLQPLLAVYRRAALDRRVAAVRRERAHGLDGASMRTLTEGLTFAPVPVPTVDTADIDTWADAARFDATPPTASVAAGDHPTHSGGAR